MSQELQVSPAEVLDLSRSPSPSRTVTLPTQICIGSGSSGGLLACLMTKHAVLHAAQNPKTKHQTDVRSAHVQFYRPIFPEKDARVELQLREVNIGKGWSTFRVEIVHGSNAKVAASADVILTAFAIPGVTLSTGWELSPPAHRVDLSKLETLDDPDWACYHTAFHPRGFRRGMAYVQYHIPRQVPSAVKFVEQWVAPGWDCTPSGSRDPGSEKARWTNELIQFVVDLSLPVQENFRPADELKASLGSLVATLAFSARQDDARRKDQSDWRGLHDDGSLPEKGLGLFKNAMINATLTMSTEIKKKLPEEGVRWLYMRAEAKKLEGSRMDLEVLLLDESMELVAISRQVAWIVTGVEKTQKTQKSSLPGASAGSRL